MHQSPVNMGLLLILCIFIFGVSVSSTDILPNEDPLQNMESTISNSVDELLEQFSLRSECPPTNKCRRKKGTCIPSSETCNGQAKNGCGANCTCCVMETEICAPKPTCSDVNGFCMRNPGNCPGYIIENGCSGSGCICCVNDNDCPNGFYRVGTECFKIYDKFASWDDAREICKDNGWQLAEPEDMTALATFIHDEINVQYYFWIGGRGIGESFMYLSGQGLQDDAPWGEYGGTTLEDCLAMGSTSSLFNTSLVSFDCNNKYFFICEPGCPVGFIRVGSSCYKIVSRSLRWDDAEVNCYEEGLTLAEPEDPVKLAGVLYNGVGGSTYRSSYWLGGRGGRINGSIIAWNSGDPVPDPYPNNSTWRSGYPRYFTDQYCLQLYTHYHNSGPLYEYYCTSSYYSICELICPFGFFHIGNRCYKAFSSSKSSWAEAQAVCEEAHLTLAQPEDPITLANFLFIATGHHNYWLGGRGDGTTFRWSSGEVIPSNWSAWQSGNPGSKVGRDDCLKLVPEHRATPLTSANCALPLYPLCQ